MFDLAIAIPAGRKAGKYLQKIYPVPDLSSLVKSLEYEGAEFKNALDYEDALTDCQSCQSGRHELFYRVYSQLPDIRFVGLTDKLGDVVARCLINVRRGTFAPTYGKYHFMLEQRLIFAGYEPGQIVDLKDVRPLLNRTILPATPPDKFPASLKKAETIRYTKPEPPKYAPDITKACLESAIDAREWFVSEVPEQYILKSKRVVDAYYSRDSIIRRKMSCENIYKHDRYHAIDNRILTAPDRWEKHVKQSEKDWAAYENSLKRYDRGFKKIRPSVKYGSPFERTIERTAPISEDYYFQAEDIIYSQQSTLYIDFNRKFISQTITQKSGWYLKKTK